MNTTGIQARDAVLAPALDKRTKRLVAADGLRNALT